MTGSEDCPKCGRANPPRQLLCEHCGHSLEWAPAAKMSRKWPSAGMPLLGVLAGLSIGWFAQRHTPVTAPTVSVRPQLDVVFTIDATGSMGDEIDVVKHEIKSMMDKLASGQPAPMIRFGLVSYKDHGDEYVTKAQPLTSDSSSIQAAVDELRAFGGGDTPEAVDEGLHVAIEEMNWSTDPKTHKMLFLIGDAGPHQQCVFDYRQEARLARERGIKINCWGCSGIEECGEPEFREIATLGGGQFNFLTYRQGRVLYQGGASYTVNPGSRADSDWKSGADSVVRNYGTAVVKSSSKVDVPQTGTDNNLDHVLTDQVKEEAAAAGVRY